MLFILKDYNSYSCFQFPVFTVKRQDNTRLFEEIKSFVMVRFVIS